MGTDGPLIRFNEDAIRIEVILWETGLSELPSGDPRSAIVAANDRWMPNVG
jgi:hypothetical protein